MPSTSGAYATTTHEPYQHISHRRPGRCRTVRVSCVMSPTGTPIRVHRFIHDPFTARLHPLRPDDPSPRCPGRARWDRCFQQRSPPMLLVPGDQRQQNKNTHHRQNRDHLAPTVTAPTSSWLAAGRPSIAGPWSSVAPIPGQESRPAAAADERRTQRSDTTAEPRPPPLGNAGSSTTWFRSDGCQRDPTSFALPDDVRVCSPFESVQAFRMDHHFVPPGIGVPPVVDGA